MPKILEITLTPRGRFFFGQEIVFGGANGEDKRRRSYLVHSGLLPQQTSLLGALREAILRRNDALLPPQGNGTKSRASELVGPKSFTFQESDQSFGAIRALSPVVIRDQDGSNWQPQPIDDVIGKKADSIHQEVAWEAFPDGTWRLRHYDDKVGMPLRFGNGETSRKLDKLFREQTRVGVRISNRNGWRNNEDGTTDDDEGFYRQTFRANKNSAYADAKAAVSHRKEWEEEGKAEPFTPPKPGSRYQLVFRVEVDASSIQDYKELVDAFITLGGERSGFDLEVTDVSGESLDGHFEEVKYQQHTTPLPEGYGRLVLMSDAYVDTDYIREVGGFIVGEAQPFRYFSTDINETKNFYYLAFDRSNPDRKQHIYNPDGRRQSKKYTLLKRGSIILVAIGASTALSTDIAPALAPLKATEELVKLDLTTGSTAKAVAEHILAQTPFRRIGYNYLKFHAQ